MLIRFWGTRGSIAKPGPATVRYGGNTSCVELRSDAGTLVVLDCGTGAHPLGQELVARGKGKTRGHILISHTHWDHIQGLPFFAPLFGKGGDWDIYGPAGLSEGLRQTLAGQMEHTYFPISMEQFQARIRYHDLVEGRFTIDDIEVTASYLNHPALTLGYRFQADNAVVVYSCDHEPYSAAAAAGDAEITGRDVRHLEFLKDADVVIHDSQYLAAEYGEKAGWGHSTAEYVVRACQQAGVGKVVLTHHDPLRDDAAVDKIVHDMRRRAAKGPPLEVLGAAEGLELRVAGSEPVPGQGKRRDAQAPVSAGNLARQIVMKVADPELRETLVEAAALEGLPPPVLVAEGEVLPALSSVDCALVLLEHRPPALDAVKTARAIRLAESAQGARIPVIGVTRGDPGPRAVETVTDWLVAPFSISYARTRIRAWILRVACRWARAGKPADEPSRLQALYDLNILDTPPDARFDRVTRIAANAFNVPIALVSLVDSERQWFKSCIGLDDSETPRESAFCAHAVEQRRDIVVPDTLLDDRFADNPLVTGEPRLRFYAGAPLILANGACLGTLCILDRRPHHLTESDLELLHDLRDMVVAELETGRQPPR